MSRRSLIAVAGAALALGTTVTSLAAQRAQQTMIDQELALRAGGDLVIDVDDADVEIETGPGAARVRVVLSARDLDWARAVFDDMAFTIRPSANGVTITSQEARVSWRERRRNRGLGVTVRVRVPAESNVRVATGDGDVSLGDLQGRADIRTSDGDVLLGTISGSRITVRTSDGDVDAVSLGGGAITVSTSDGDVSIGSVRGTLDASTGDGDIRIGLLEAHGINLETGDGDIIIQTPTTLAATFDLRGEDIHVARELTVLGSLASDRLLGTMNGGGPTLSARTGDGSIVVTGR